ncbi:L-rhamnose mutarotase [Sphingomonas sp. ASY06-1R]|uniref:L-rhamnose mutarotase n=1 Tax=Sphingomonas sp. ASY06-1R TaxID=3445771 RepID=UPI003FA27347
MRHVLLLDLVDDEEAIAAYRNWHRPGGPPEAVTRAIRESGIASMEIWHVGDRLAMVMETTPAYTAASVERSASDPDVRAWETLMDRLQRPLPFAPAGQKRIAAERIYDLAAQPTS